MKNGFTFCTCSVNQYYCNHTHAQYRLETPAEFKRYLPVAMASFATGNNIWGEDVYKRQDMQDVDGMAKAVITANLLGRKFNNGSDVTLEDTMMNLMPCLLYTSIPAWLSVPA